MDNQKEIDKIDMELVRYLIKNKIPFQLKNGIWHIETTNCTENQKDNILQIEYKKKAYLKL